MGISIWGSDAVAYVFVMLAVVLSLLTSCKRPYALMSDHYVLSSSHYSILT